MTRRRPSRTGSRSTAITPSLSSTTTRREESSSPSPASETSPRSTPRSRNPFSEQGRGHGPLPIVIHLFVTIGPIRNAKIWRTAESKSAALAFRKRISFDPIRDERSKQSLFEHPYRSGGSCTGRFYTSLQITARRIDSRDVDYAVRTITMWILHNTVRVNTGPVNDRGSAMGERQDCGATLRTIVFRLKGDMTRSNYRTQQA